LVSLLIGQLTRAFLETTDLPFREASNIRRLAADDDTETAWLLEVSVLLQIAVCQTLAGNRLGGCQVLAAIEQ
jgi:hypothetical protein